MGSLDSTVPMAPWSDYYLRQPVRQPSFTPAAPLEPVRHLRTAPPPQLAEARHGVLEILALLFALLFWPIGLVFGHASSAEAHRAHRYPSVLATTALTVSYVLATATILALLVSIFTMLRYGHSG